MVWNKRSKQRDSDSWVHTFYFLIINNAREIEKNKERIYDKLKPILEKININSEIVPNTNSRLRYEMFFIKIHVSEFNPR